MQFVSNSFKLGVQIAAPFIVYGLVYQIGLGFMQRLMPQLQLFFVAMPLQIMMALFVFMTTLSAMMLWFLDHFESSMASFLAN
jgi:flagellar biosynthetic protein FliR